MPGADTLSYVVGTVAQVWRYPVKSMGGERLPAVTLTDRGLEGDRGFAVLDVASGKILSAKKERRLLLASARTCPDNGVLVRLPGGTELEAGDPRLDQCLSGWLGRASRLVRPLPGQRALFEKVLDDEDEEANGATKELATQPGVFFDTKSALHVLTTASLRAAHRLYPEGDWDVRRFRPNLLVDTAGTGTGDEGFPEEAWPGGTLTLGEATAWVRKATPRCSMTTRPQGTLPEDRGIHRTLARLHHNILGALAHPAGRTVVHVGDTLRLTPGQPSRPEAGRANLSDSTYF
ncbi:MOSC domain-containing protein [Streptomyces gamaensis]|uniref:MOSC domain-containing protein n=1 Tax=Streptomyces gamaensis TaxID=1763542 RepID=A0ABW0YWZ0_9ACTN